MVVIGGLAEIDEIVRRLKEAVLTLRLLRAANARPAGFRSFWPAVVRDAFEAFNPDEPESAKLLRAFPSPDAISRMDEAISWLVPLTERQRVLVFARAGEVRWPALVVRLGRDRRQLREEYYEALIAIAAWRRQAA